MNSLFVYGTLAPGKENHRVLAGFSGRWEQATLNGTLVNEGWGSNHGCPGIIPSASAPEVQGYLFTSEDLHHNWHMLDAFEGEDYTRESVTVMLTDGTAVDAYVYAIVTSKRV